MSSSGKKVVLGISGSIAAVKAPELVRWFLDHGHKVNCLLTPGAAQFVSKLALSTFCGEKVISDMFGEEAFQMPHLGWANEADVFVVAPASATVMARMAYGLAEDMISLTYLNVKAPVLVAPAMHNTMWDHPATQSNVKLLKERGVSFVGPIAGPLADTTQGEGRMSESADIVKAAEALIKKKA
jgi:phosphopantothenoylcysteine decarboxylase / phosphopantothenate---cysteine ligase